MEEKKHGQSNAKQNTKSKKKKYDSSVTPKRSQEHSRSNLEEKELRVKRAVSTEEKIARKKAKLKKEKEAKMKRRKLIKKVLGIAATLFALLIIAYCGYGYTVYSDKFMPGSTVEGIKCGNVSSSSFIDALNGKINDYSLAVKKNGDAVDSIKASDVKLTASQDMPAKVRQAIQSQNKLKWGLGYIRKNEEIYLDNILIIDDKVFDDYIKTSAGYNLPTTIENAEQSVIFDNGKYKVSDPVYGDEIDKKAYADKVKENMLNFNSEMNLEDSDCYTKPKAAGNKSKYEKACEEANNIIDYGSLNITAEGFKGDLAKEIIEASLVIDDDFKVSINKDTIASAVKSISDKYNTKGGTRKFKTSHGTVVDVKGGDYGCSLKLKGIDSAVENALLKGGNEQKTVTFSKNLLNPDVDGIGDTYVEIDLTNQYVWVYVDGKIVTETPCVSGLAGGSRETPQGVYLLKNKLMDVPLVGTNYVTPVKYWMPFNGGIGLHDAVWQSRFGGELYKSRGSHGCINLPMDKAEKIYKNVVVNMPVVLYYDTRLPDKFYAVPSTGMIAGQYRALTSSERAMLANIKAGRPAGSGAVIDSAPANNTNTATDVVVTPAAVE